VRVGDSTRVFESDNECPVNKAGEPTPGQGDDLTLRAPPQGLAPAKGCSYYPFSGSTLRALAGDLGGYDMTRGALHFRPDKPLPAALVRKLVKARIAETEAGTWRSKA